MFVVALSTGGNPGTPPAILHNYFNPNTSSPSIPVGMACVFDYALSPDGASVNIAVTTTQQFPAGVCYNRQIDPQSYGLVQSFGTHPAVLVNGTISIGTPLAIQVGVAQLAVATLVATLTGQFKPCFVAAQASSGTTTTKVAISCL